MKDKSHKTVRGILQEWEMIPITAPAEQAALDRRCREAENMPSERAKPKKTKPRKSK
jgi:hypothetical protein